MPGTNQPLIAIGDSDGLIALLHEEDANFAKATATVQDLLQRDAQIIFPVTTIVETITTLTRKLNKPKLAKRVIEKIGHGELTIEPCDNVLLETALRLFDPNGSKRNTLFDALVA